MMKFDCKVRIEGHTDELSQLIKGRVPFRLGARGICCDCTPTVRDGKFLGWEVVVPRAHTVIECDDLGVTDDDEEFCTLDVTFDNGNTWYGYLDLTQYDVFSYGVRYKAVEI